MSWQPGYPQPSRKKLDVADWVWSGVGCGSGVGRWTDAGAPPSGRPADRPTNRPADPLVGRLAGRSSGGRSTGRPAGRTVCRTVCRSEGGQQTGSRRGGPTCRKQVVNKYTHVCPEHIMLIVGKVWVANGSRMVRKWFANGSGVVRVWVDGPTPELPRLADRPTNRPADPPVGRLAGRSLVGPCSFLESCGS